MVRVRRMSRNSNRSGGYLICALRQAIISRWGEVTQICDVEVDALIDSATGDVLTCRGRFGAD
jgi:hypothetical protein